MDIKRGRIVITKSAEGGKIDIESVVGLWNGKDRMVIANHLRKAMRKAKYDIVKAHKQADLLKSGEVVISGTEKSKEQIAETLKLIKEPANKNIKIEEKEKCPKTTKIPKKKLLMKKPKR